VSAPTRPAWFAHRHAAERRLGAFLPSQSTWYDLGPLDEQGALADGRLRDLQALVHDTGARTMVGPPETFDIPVARPSKILCLGKNFVAHAAEFGAAVPEEPIFFTKLSDTLLPHGAPVVLPHWIDSRIDHELELAVILGFHDPHRRGRKYVAAAQAMELVAGYTVLNDVTARQMQGEDRNQKHPWLRSKSFDTFCPIGPWVVPVGALPEVAALDMQLHVNDELRQRSNTSLMVVDIPHAIEYLSRHTTLRPGDIIAMGTPEGVGPLRDGDSITCDIAAIGTLRNPVRREATPATLG
jgi:2-keto-4-pentenoate hydratase/2-oxohepta-3-ene-1,7-dioic acid hydratase in catechol pathway